MFFPYYSFSILRSRIETEKGYTCRLSVIFLLPFFLFASPTRRLPFIYIKIAPQHSHTCYHRQTTPQTRQHLYKQAIKCYQQQSYSLMKSIFMHKPMKLLSAANTVVIKSPQDNYDFEHLHECRQLKSLPTRTYISMAMLALGMHVQTAGCCQNFIT